MDFEKLFIGAFGAAIGVIGWLFVGLYIQRRAKDRAAREAARVVYFELAANHLNVYTALTYGAFGPLTRTSFDRLLPELAAWLPGFARRSRQSPSRRRSRRPSAGSGPA